MLKHSTLTMHSLAGTDQLIEQLHHCTQFPAILNLPMPQIDAFAWLESQPFEVKLAWSERENSDIVAGVGVAACVEVTPDNSPESAIQTCRVLMNGNEELRFFGGLSFDGQNGWSNFGAGRFIAPRFLLHNHQLSITVMNLDDVPNAIRDLQRLNYDLPSADFRELPRPVSTRYAPTQDGWLSTIDEALTLIRSEVLEKIVLARKTTLKFEETLNPLAIAARISAATYDCYVFCFQFQEGQAFVGATPERLFRRQGNRLLSEVVAGTRPRGVTSGEDQRLAYDLLTSEKDQLEHDIVRKSIRQKLHKFVKHLDVDSHASVLRLAHKQHLCSAVEGELNPGVEEDALLKRLHPTPAVGGYPTENALPEIARLEPFNRGWYAAPVGWIGCHEAEFVVGIRSGLVEGDTLSLFSGAGIVKGSDPMQEWSEVDNKIRDFLDLFPS